MFVLRRRSERTAGGNKQESCYIDKEKTLEDLGLVFCESTGCLLERGSGTRHELKGPFKTKKALEEKRCLHEAIGMEICNMIEQRGFKKERCVLNAQIMAKEGFVQIPNVFSYFYHNLTGSENRILVLVSGFSRARVGQWSGDILSRQGLKSGSMLPYLDRCKERNMGVVLCNPYEQFYWRGRTWTHLPLEADEDVVNPPEMIIARYFNLTRVSLYGQSKEVYIVAVDEGPEFIIQALHKHLWNTDKGDWLIKKLLKRIVLISGIYWPPSPKHNAEEFWKVFCQLSVQIVQHIKHTNELQQLILEEEQSMLTISAGGVKVEVEDERLLPLEFIEKIFALFDLTAKNLPIESAFIDQPGLNTAA